MPPEWLSAEATDAQVALGR